MMRISERVARTGSVVVATALAVLLSFAGSVFGQNGNGASGTDGPALSAIFEIAGNSLVEFTVAGNVPGMQERAREMARCLANMPPEHHQYFAPIYVVPTLPGGRTTGGGFYPKDDSHGTSLSVWLNRSDRTGIPNSVIEEDLGRNIPGVVAITHDRLRSTPRIHELAITHEMAHAVQVSGKALTGEGVTTRQLAQRYPNGALREHAAEAYSRYIARPHGVCRQDQLPRGESMAQCTERVVALLRAAPAFQNVSSDWAPLANCKTNDQLDEPISTDTDATDAADAGDNGGSSEGGSGDDIAPRGTGGSTQAGIPHGKGMFFQRPIRGSLNDALEKLERADINWLALPARNAASIERIREIAESFLAQRDGGQIFIWRGGQEQNTGIRGQVEALVNAATELSAEGIILDPERHFNPNQVGRARAQAASQELIETARSLATPHGLTVGVTSFPAFPGLNAFSSGDYGMPQIYDRRDDKPANYAPRMIARWQSAFDLVVPLLGNFHCTSDSGCSTATAKSDGQLQQLISETEPPNGAVGWFRWGYSRDSHLPIIAEMDLGSGGGSRPPTDGDDDNGGNGNDDNGDSDDDGDDDGGGGANDSDGDSNDGPAGDVSSDEELRLIGRDQDWLVFNDDALRDEVVEYIWAGRYQPREDELFSRFDRNRTRRPGDLDLVFIDTHWEIARGRPGWNDSRLWTAIRPAVRREIDALPDLTDEDEVRNNSRPHWIPADVWTDLLDRLGSNNDSVEVYRNRSPAETDIVGVIRNRNIGAYAEMIEDVDRLRVLYDVLPPTRWEQLTGESSEQAAMRWLAEAHEEYNTFMLREVRDGRSVREARRRWEQHSRARLVITILESLQRGIGPGTAREAEAAVALFQFLMGLGGSEADRLR